MMTRARLSQVAAIALLTIAIATAGVSANPPQLPLAFEINEGQWSDEIRFLARGRAGMVALEDRRAVLIPGEPAATTIRMEIVGSRKPLIEGIDPMPHKTHYFIGGDPAEWRRDVRSYRRVVYRQIYDGIDAVFHGGHSGELEYDFIVHSGSDPRTIRFRFDGAASVAIEKGELIIRTGGDPIRMMRPVAYQVSGEGRSEVAVRYRISGKGTVGFVVGEYDRSKELVIDPVVIGYSTFLGGSGDDHATAIAVDSDRNIYVAGNTNSPDFPTKGGVRPSIAGGRDLFVAKLNPAGSEVLFSTFLGGSRDETGRPEIAVDSRGDVYVVGSTQSTDFPTTPGAPQRTFGGGPADAYVVKLSGDGARLLFATFLGGEGGDQGNGMAIDPMRDIYVGGATSSTRFPVTSGAFQSSLRSSRDGYVAKLRVDPPGVVYATYFGGTNETLGLELAVDAAGAAYLTGRTLATDLPTTPGALQTRFAGAGSGDLRLGDGFVAKFHPEGTALVYSTYLGGSSGESPEAIAVDATGAAHIAGLTYSTDFPATAGSFQPRHGGGDADNFVAKLSPTGDRLEFATYLGGTNSEQANAIAVDRLGNIHVSGTTSATNFPTTSDALSRSIRGANDAFVSIISGDGSRLLYSTYLGGTAPSGGPQDNLWAMAVDAAGNTYVAGQTRSSDFPVTAGAVQSSLRGGDDVYITRFNAQRERPAGTLRIVPVVGSTPGALGSFFKTSFQLHNPRNGTIGGRLLFHSQGASGSDGDPFLDYFLLPGETMAISDLLPAMSRSGLGSVDLLAAEGEVPETVIRIFNDAGERGTTGMSEEPVAAAEALQMGTRGVLIAPASTSTSRFNIGVRTLSEGASFAIEVRRRDGSLAHATARTYPSNFFEQRSAADFLGVTLGDDHTISFRLDSGSAIVYGSTTDNITQDPSLQVAQTVNSVSGEMRILPVVGSTPGALGSFFKTAVQLHNASDTEISGRLVFHSQNVSGSAVDPSLTYSLKPGQTTSWEDLLPAMGLSGLGSVDIISTAGPLPLSVVRIFNDAGERGTTGMTEDQLALGSVLREGDEGVLITPPDPAKSRFNIGVRTLSEGAVISVTVRNSFGNVVRTVTKEFPSTFFTQTPAATLVETDLQGSDSIRVRIESGAAVIYGATTDNISQDPSLKIVRRLE